MIYLTLAGVFVVAAGLLLAGLGGRYRLVAGGIAPGVRARCAAVGVAGAVLFIWVGLGIIVVPAAVAVLPSSTLAAWPRLVSGARGGLVGTGLVAGGLLGLSAWAVAARAARWRRERRERRVGPWIGWHWQRPEFELVFLPVAAPFAYSLGGRRAQVVISEGLRDLLDDEGLAAVVAHEAAHISGRHDRWLRLASLADAALWFVPWVRCATGVLRVSLEQWADQEAVAVVGTEPLRAALLAVVAIEPSPMPVASLSGAAAVSERLALLDSQQPTGSARLSVAGVVSLVALSAAAQAGAGGLVAALAVLHHLCGV